MLAHHRPGPSRLKQPNKQGPSNSLKTFHLSVLPSSNTTSTPKKKRPVKLVQNLSPQPISPNGRPRLGSISSQRAPREGWCSFCSREGGFDDGNQNMVRGEISLMTPPDPSSHPEPARLPPDLQGPPPVARRRGKGEMVSCWECGQSGHFSCLELTNLVIKSHVKSYPWLCLECRRCTGCDQKGDDQDMLLCAVCDRGWHGACLNPPIKSVPSGDFICPYPHSSAPSCPPLPDTVVLPPLPPTQPSSTTPLRSTSSAKPNRSTATKKRKAPLLKSDDDDSCGWDRDSANSSEPRPSKKLTGGTPRYGSRDRLNGARSGSAGLLVEPEGGPSGLKSSHVSSRSGSLLGLPAEGSKTKTLSVTEDGVQDDVVQAQDQPMDLVPGQDNQPAAEDTAQEVNPYAGVLTEAEAYIGDRLISDDDIARFKQSLESSEARLEALGSESIERAGQSPPTSITVPNSTQSSLPPSTSGVELKKWPRAVRELRAFSGPSSPDLKTRLASGSSVASPMAADSPTGNEPDDDSSTSSTLQGIGPKRTAGQESPATNLQPIKSIRFGQYEIENWYQAPYPEEYSVLPNGQLFICEYCLKYFKTSYQHQRHRLKCKVCHPPGDEIYRDEENGISVFEVDGRKNKMYCQNLCLLAKMFLDHKTLYYDVDPFLFYVMTQTNFKNHKNNNQSNSTLSTSTSTTGPTISTITTTTSITMPPKGESCGRIIVEERKNGCEFVGYFSKEKRSPSNNVSCIMTLPVRQRMGWGNLLIDFSYLLSKKERRVGTPEKPLSDLGLLSYRSYWTLSISRYLSTCSPSDQLTLEDIANETSIAPGDVLYTCRHKGWIHEVNTPEPKGGGGAGASRLVKANQKRKSSGYRALSSRKKLSGATSVAATSNAGSAPRETGQDSDPGRLPQYYRIAWEPADVEAAVVAWKAKKHYELLPDKLAWSPFVMTTRGKTLAGVGIGKGAALGTLDVGPIAVPLIPETDPYGFGGACASRGGIGGDDRKKAGAVVPRVGSRGSGRVRAQTEKRMGGGRGGEPEASEEPELGSGRERSELRREEIKVEESKVVTENGREVEERQRDQGREKHKQQFAVLDDVVSEEELDAEGSLEEEYMDCEEGEEEDEDDDVDYQEED